MGEGLEELVEEAHPNSLPPKKGNYSVLLRGLGQTLPDLSTSTKSWGKLHVHKYYRSFGLLKDWEIILIFWLLKSHGFHLLCPLLQTDNGFFEHQAEKEWEAKSGFSRKQSWDWLRMSALGVGLDSGDSRVVFLQSRVYIVSAYHAWKAVRTLSGLIP